ncbi:heterokaryon incompatibility protein-domain-containing protein [Leptodontidium sp. 2 PMI_412]|nr:heterokaryon incompatibility protein-domain-containing protein [Leptodontidium sp. 2 PMI_412]
MVRFKRSFEYQALHDTNSIRVIELFPALDNDKPIIINLSEFLLNSPIQYEALSYTWDDQKPTRDITCNEASLYVTENVFQALRQLRKSRKARRRILWIDAICINQNDQAEKTSQVSMMGNIYARAHRVNIWLNHSTEAMRAVFEYIRLSTSPKLSFDKVSDENVAILKDGLEQLSSHPYWTRVWTVQEVALSENCWIYLGQLKPLNMLEFGVMLYEVEGYLNLRSEEITQPDVEYLYPIEFKRGMPSAATILHRCLRPNSFATDQIDGNTLRHLMGKKAKIPLDVIFAYRALFPESIGQIKVDYQRDLIDVLREFTFRIVPCLAKLGDLLETVSYCPDIPDAPSWVLNITDSGHVWNATHYFGVWYATHNFGVPSPSTANSPMTHRISPDMNTLHVKGIIVDRVAVISDEFPHYLLENQATWHEKVRDMLIQWRICTHNALIASFEESIIEILFAATNAVEEMRDKVLVYDKDDETLLTNSVYRIHPVENPPDRDLQVVEKDKKKKARTFALREWIDDPDINYRLDHEEILSSVRSECYGPPTIHSPALGGRSLFVTSQGKMALGKNLQLSDAIALISGCDVPFILRPVPQRESYTLGLPVLLPGVMLGQAWPEDQYEKLEEIKIV